MHSIFLRRLLVLVFFLSFGAVSVEVCASWFNLDDTIHLPDQTKDAAKNVKPKYAVTLHTQGYSDQRSEKKAQKIGVSTQHVLGLSGTELVLDRDVADFVTVSMRKRFNEAGFQVVEESSAMYELSGVIRELTYNVKERDEILIAIETTLKESASGKTIWSGVVSEQKERFAGVSGNNKSDIANVLQYELNIVTKKTVDAISANLQTTRPDLFNLATGGSAIPGVVVLQAASAVTSSSSQTGTENRGTLILRTAPDRAKIYLQGVYFGMSPLHTEIPVGIHEVSVKLDGYKTAMEKVSVRKGEITELELTLERY